MTPDANRDVVEIFHVYRKTVDETGIPQIRSCVVSAGVKEGEAKEGPLEYLHGQYPCVVHQRENLSRAILDSRGVADIAATWQ